MFNLKRLVSLTLIKINFYFGFLFLLFEIPLFILKNRKIIFKNKLLYLESNWSFGHTFAGFDYVSRIFFPRKISLIYIPFLYNNKFLPECFPNLDFVIFESCFPFKKEINEIIKYNIFIFYIRVVLVFRPEFYLVEREFIYQTLSIANQKIKHGHSDGVRYTPSPDWTGYVRLLHERIGVPPEIPMKFKEFCDDKIKEKFPDFFDKPFACVLLRNKGDRVLTFDSFCRNASPSRDYIPSIRYLIDSGFHVVATGETDVVPFLKIDGFFDTSDLAKSNPDLFNLYFLMNSEIFLGQQSGPHLVPNSRYHTCIITEALPYRLGTFQKEDIILFKKFRKKIEKKPLLMSEVFKNHMDWAFGADIQNENVQIINNTSEEILKTVQEGVEKHLGTWKSNPDVNLWKKDFRSLLSDEMALYYHENYPPEFVLEEMFSKNH